MNAKLQDILGPNQGCSFKSNDCSIPSYVLIRRFISLKDNAAPNREILPLLFFFPDHKLIQIDRRKSSQIRGQNRVFLYFLCVLANCSEWTPLLKVCHSHNKKLYWMELCKFMCDRCLSCVKSMTKGQNLRSDM